MAKPADFTTPQLNTGWAHYANVVAATPLMNDTAECLVDAVTNAITITSPGGTAVWDDATSGGRGLKRSTSTAGDSILYENMMPTGTSGTVITIHEVETAVTAIGRYFLSGTAFNLRYANSTNQVQSRLRSTVYNCTGSTGIQSGDYLRTTGYKVAILTWDADERHFYHSALVDGSGIPTDGYTGAEANYAPGPTTMGDCYLMSTSAGDDAVTGVVLLGIVTLDTMLTQTQAAAIIADPWAWVEDGTVVNAVPSFDGPSIANIAGTVGSAITSNDVSGRFSDADGDTLTFTGEGTWPARAGGGDWVSSAGVISGTPDTGSEGSYTGLTVRADDGTDTKDSNTFTFIVNAAGSVPTISAVSGPVVHGGAFTITGTNLADVDTLTIDYDSLSASQTITSQTETQIVLAAAATSSLPYGAVTLTATESGTGTSTFEVTHSPPAGRDYVVVDVPWGTTALSIFDGDPDTAAVDGDQIDYDIESSIGSAVIVRGDGTLRVASDTGRHSFDVRLWDESELTWGASTQIIVTESAYTPGAPVFIGPNIASADLTTGDEWAVSIDGLWDDPDDDIVSYSLEGDWPSWVSLSGTTISGTAGAADSFTSLYVRATDSTGLYGDSNQIEITVTGVPRDVSTYIDRIAFRPGTVRSVGEGSGVVYGVTCLASGTVATPETMRYRVDDDRGNELLAWTAATVGTTTTVVIPASIQQMRSEGNSTEWRTLTVEADYGTEYAFSDSIRYKLVNQFGL